MCNLLKRKFLLIVTSLVIVGAGVFVFFYFKNGNNDVQYVTSPAEKGTIVVSVNGSGQVSASNQIDIKSKTSGDVVYIAAKEGQKVQKGSLLLQLDATDAQKSVRDAQANLDGAKLALAKLNEPADRLSILQAQNALAQAQETKQNAETDLANSYDNGFTSTANAFLDLPTVVSGLQDVLFGVDKSLNSGGSWNIDYYVNAAKFYDAAALQYRDDAYKKYQAANQEYDNSFQDYKATSMSSSATTVASLIGETYDTTKTVADAVKSANNLIQFYKDKLKENGVTPQALADSQLAILSGYTAKVNSHLTDLSAIQSTIENDKSALVANDRSIVEKTEALDNLSNGPDALDVKSQELVVQQRQNSLLDAQQSLADAYVRAPFDGVAAKINVQNGDPVSTSMSVVTFITQQKVANISLNEVDTAKVKVGDKATLTFDAISGLSISGEVAEIDTIGTVSQGVVNYNVKIAFDTQDSRVKSGMSVSAEIITDVKQDVVIVPNSAIKSAGNAKSVALLVNAKPQVQQVETGLSNDTMTEIVSGLNAGDNIVTQTINASTQKTQTAQQSNIFRMPGFSGGGGGGGMRGGSLGR